MELKEEKIIYKKVSELKLNEKNPRKNDGKNLQAKRR